MQMTFGSYSLKLHERLLVGPEGPVQISGRSVELLAALLQRPNELLGKDDLFDAVWPGVVVEENTLQVHISALRKAIGDGFIATVHGRGYRYIGPIPLEAPDDTASLAVPKSGNIQRHRTECVARDVEIETIAKLIESNRLVSIIGPGGVGKTTVAATVADRMAAEFAGGVWMVELAAVSSGDHLASALVQALAVPFRAGTDSLKAVLEHLGSSQCLLVLDNCEHLRGAVARLVACILREAPLVRVLTSSQIALRMPEERVFKLKPFAVSATDGADEGGLASAQFLAHCYAAHGEAISVEEAPVVARLCRRLDGVALALKMAAARAATLGIAAVDQQLEDHLAGLSADWHPSLARHRSLAASLAWSYDLLSEEEQRTLRCLGVFQGSFSLAGVNAVAGAGADVHMTELLRRSLVVRDSADHSRYRLLDANRRFMLDQLMKEGEDAAVRERHARYVEALFKDSIAQWEVLTDDIWDKTYKPDGNDFRAALAWAKAAAAWPSYVSLAANCYRYFMEEQLGAEGLATIKAAMPLVDSVEPVLAAHLQLALGEICRFNAMDNRARSGLEAAMAFFRGSGDRFRYCQALIVAAAAAYCGDCPSAGPCSREGREGRSFLEELEGAVAEQAPSKMKSWGLVAVGIHLWRNGETVAGLARCEAGLAMHAATGNPKGRLRSAMHLSEMFHRGDDTERSLRLVEQILPELRRNGPSLQLGYLLSNLSTYYLALADLGAARGPLDEAAAIVPHNGNNWHCALLQSAAELLFLDGEIDAAAMLLGAADKAFEDWPDGRQTTERLQRDRLFGNLNKVLMRDGLGRLMLQGRALSLFEADHLAGFHTAAPGNLRL